MGNPGLFKINEVVVGVTATGVLFQLSSQGPFHNGRDNSEIAKMPRVARLASTYCQQRSFYPLFPPLPCLRQWPTRPSTCGSTKWKLPLQPDVLITPSKLQPSADVPRLLGAEPGAFVEGAGGGTFSQLTVRP